MKQVILMLSGTVIAVLVFCVIFSLQQRQLRKTKLDNARMEIMEEYMERSFWDVEFRNQSDEEFVSFFEDAIRKRISEDAEFRVNLIVRDMSAKIIGVKITEEYRHLNGNTGSIESFGVLVLEEEEDI